MRWFALATSWLRDLPGRAFRALRDWVREAQLPEVIQWGAEPFEILRIAGLPPGALESYGGVTMIPPLAPSMGIRADLIIVPRIVDAQHRDWVRQTLFTRLKPGGRMVIVA